MSWRHVRQTSLLHIHVYPRKDCRTPSSTLTHLESHTMDSCHVIFTAWTWWRKCVQALKPPQKSWALSENVTVGRCDMCGGSQITGESPQGQGKHDSTGAVRPVQFRHFLSPHSKNASRTQRSKIMSYLTWPWAWLALLWLGCSWGCHTLIPLGFTEEYFFRCVLYFEWHSPFCFKK